MDKLEFVTAIKNVLSTPLGEIPNKREVGSDIIGENNINQIVNCLRKAYPKTRITFDNEFIYFPELNVTIDYKDLTND